MSPGLSHRVAVPWRGWCRLCCPTPPRGVGRGLSGLPPPSPPVSPPGTQRQGGDNLVALPPSPFLGGVRSSRQRQRGMEVPARRSQAAPRRLSPEATQQALPAGNRLGRAPAGAAAGTGPVSTAPGWDAGSGWVQGAILGGRGEMLRTGKLNAPWLRSHRRGGDGRIWLMFLARSGYPWCLKPTGAGTSCRVPALTVTPIIPRVPSPPPP